MSTAAPPYQPSAFVALTEKYRRMLALRATLGVTSSRDRETLRALAHDFPGALRELETLPTHELEQRHAAAQCAAQGGGVPAWLAWTAEYHTLMRRALELRARATKPSDEFDARVARPTHGRLNVVVFAALAKTFGVSASTIWDTLFPRLGTAERQYRAP